MRRAQEKADQKQADAKERLKAERILKRQKIRARRAAPKKAASNGSSAAPAKPKNPPGRFSGALSIFVTAFVALQAIVPAASDQNPNFSLLVNLMYYLMFGYFVQMWLSRQNQANPVYKAVAVGSILTLGLIAVQFFLPPAIEPQIRMAFLGIPAIIVGSLLSYLVFTRAP